MESDERFKHLALDPRFKTLRKKQRKVEIDDRFKSMFTDKKFTLKYTKDKRGRNNKKTSGDDLKKYYSLKDDDKEIEQEEEKSDKQEDDDDDNVSGTGLGDQDIQDKLLVDKEENDEGEDQKDKEEEEEADTPESELSSSSDESESEMSETDDAKDEENEVHINNIEYNWQPLDHDAETAEKTSKRLAIQNLDWDHLDVKDIYTLVHSIRPPVSVKIYVSEYGKERLKEEELHGPKEIVEMPKVDQDEEEYNMLKQKMEAFESSKQPRTYKINEYEDADEELDPKNEEIRERIRRYQLNRMKYYYAVVEFDSIESAEIVYKELDGMEYEGSSLELDLRFIDDDIEFDNNDVQSECNKVPDLTSYTAPQFINSAIQQTTVKFTWDETDLKRQERLHKAYTKQELEKDDLEAYLGSDTDSDSDFDSNSDDFNIQEGEQEFGDNEEKKDVDDDEVQELNSEARINKYKKLLASLEEEEEKKKKIDVDVEWGNYSEDEEKLTEEKNVTKLDEKKMKKKKHRSVDDDEETDNEHKVDPELELLVMDVNEGKKDEFKFNPDDDRFNAVYESGLYNVDPSHPNFKRTEAFDVIAEKKRAKRQKTNNK